jgi:Ig-like domain CHU_C associated
MKKNLLYFSWVFALVMATSISAIAQTITGVAVTNTSGSTSATGYCAGGQIKVAFTATGFTGTPNFDIQLSSSTGSFTTPTVLGTVLASASPATVTIPTVAATSGSYLVRVISGITNSATVAIAITNTPAPTVTAATANYCQNATANALTATGTGIIKWYDASTGGNLLSGSVPPTTSVGQKLYYATQTVNSCESQTRSASAITVNVYGYPAPPPVTTPVNYCLNATATALAGTNVLWYTTATGGTGVASITPSTTSVESKTYYATQTVNGCESTTRASLVVNVVAPAAPTATSPVVRCQDPSATVNLTTFASATGTNSLRWYNSTNSSITAPTTESLMTSGSKLYYVSQFDGTCEGPKAAITLTINTPPTAPTTSATIIK